jgi:hypothetical protein
MIRRLLVLCLLLTAFCCRSQNFGNEWINYSQQYFKIRITQDGIYRLDSTPLAASGIPLSSIDPRNLQIFHRGEEQYIHVAGEADGTFNSGDFIEFYAEKNRGFHDSALYVNTAFVPNPYYSLFTDTAVYFLTWNASTVNRRMQSLTDTAVSGLVPDQWFFSEEVKSFNGAYYAGETDVIGGTDSRYTRAEGWFDSNVLTLGGTINYSINSTNRFLSGPDATLRTVIVGASKNASLVFSGLPDHHLLLNFNSNPLEDTTFLGYSPNRFIKSLPAAALNNGPNTLQLSSLIDPGFTSNRTVMSYMTLKYARTTDLAASSAFSMLVPDNLFQSKSYFTFTNFSAGSAAFVYDLTNKRRIEAFASGADWKVLIPNGGGEKKCFLASANSVQSVTILVPVGPSAQFVNYMAGATDSAFIIITHPSLNTSAVSYKNYRSSIAGGSQNVILADVLQLYDQFAYGESKNPLAIRNFSKTMISVNPAFPPQNLFLVGKSIHQHKCRQNAANNAANLVPSWGFPSSDHLITAGLAGTTIAPGVPTGRISAKNTGDVDLYLYKVQQYESNEPAEWMKQILHFGGGATAAEQAAFKGYLNTYKAIIEDTLYGGTVKDFFKTSSAPIQINTSDTLRDLLNNGVSLMTFFGHASGTGFDQSIDDVNSYNPLPGRYPFLLANSCYAGDLHNPDETSFGFPLSSSETFVLTPNKGMIGYLGSVGLGVPYALNTFSTHFYKELALESYGKSVGHCVKQTITDMETDPFMDSLKRATCYEMTLHSDPYLRLNTHPQPDYKITSSDVYYDLLTDLDSFTVYVVRTNMGRAGNDTIQDELIRELPNGDTISYLHQSFAPRFRDTIAFRIPVDFVNGIGMNKLYVTLDRFDRVEEMREDNNSTGPVNVFINGGDIVPVYPYEFAIIPKDTITLKASTANPFASSRNYIFQIDTSDTFSSPLETSPPQTAPGGVVSWKPGFSFVDSTVYYWRVSVDSVDTTGYHWRESSFQYIQGKRGWEQAHFFQFKNNDYQYVKFNRPGRNFNFADDINSIQCSNGVPPHIPYFDVKYKLNNEVMYVSSWTLQGFTFAVFDPVSGEPWLNHPTTYSGGYGEYGSTTGNNIGDPPENAYDFYDSDPVRRDSMLWFLRDTVPDGHYVLGYTQQYAPFGLFHSIPSYGTDLLNAFAYLGADQIAAGAVGPQIPYIMFGRKGAGPGTAKEVIGDSISSIIQLDTSIVTNWTDGFIASPVIGPALSWDSLSWSYHSVDGSTTADSIVVQLIGIKADGSEDIKANFSTSQLDVPSLSSYISANIYPKCRLVAYMKDDSLNTPPQLDRWQVIYTPVPEAAIHPPAGYAVENGTVQEGADFRVRLPIANISEYAFSDSLLVTYWIEDADRVNHMLPQKLKRKPFAPGEIMIDTISVGTEGFPGSNVLWVEVNPIGKPRSQHEQYHFNNLARIPFTVSTDNINPLLDVTFDGVHILNNDIVSARPDILIRLKDENRFLALNDTSDFKVFLRSPGSSTAVRIYFGENMSFIPAVLPNNSCKINFTPQLHLDGSYQLIVQAKDKSDNQSGAVDYKINFEVINRSTITEVMNYPNPFSTSTRFVFTLTGGEVPTTFKIQIMTITGKVVREIFQDELGPLHVGRNITEFAWDGKDEFGDQLANGVYLYRVITKMGTEDIEKRNSGADDYFKKGWGKMYLMR